jgi:hypothetical protein
MIQVDPSTVVILALAIIGGVVWLVRLEGRQNVTDSRYEEILRRLARIESKQDEMAT